MAMTVAGLALLPAGGAVGADDIVGTHGRDELVGTRHPDTLRGRGGADALIGMYGADVLIAGRGLDNVQDGPGRDVVHLGRGNDTILTEADGFVDTFRCGPGYDYVWYWGDPEPGDVLIGCEHVGDWSH
jgi:Ca2+-binding RTX toxin-like protein